MSFNLSDNSGRTNALALHMSQPTYSPAGNISQAETIIAQGDALETGIALNNTEIMDPEKTIEGLRYVKQINNVGFIMIGGLIFIGIISWFEALRAFYDAIFEFRDVQHRFATTFRRIGYALFVTSIVIILIVLLYRNVIR
jgi:hypothetical protein